VTPPSYETFDQSIADALHAQWLRAVERSGSWIEH